MLFASGITHTYRSHCCGPVLGAGRQSQVPRTGGSTISHSLTDGPVYSGKKQMRQTNIQ